MSLALHSHARLIRARVRDIQEGEIRSCGRVYTEVNVQNALNALAEQLVDLCDAIAEDNLKQSLGGNGT